MKKLIFILTVLVSLYSCKNDKKGNIDNAVEAPRVEGIKMDSLNTTSAEVNKPKVYPAQLQAVFNAHGGLDQWKKMNNLCFEMNGKNGGETHTISLQDRKTKVEAKGWSIGFDGNQVWLLKHDLDYQGNPVFYHNLMFYFYAMPFVIADPGTNYVAVEPTLLDGKMYNGYKVSYDDGVGSSSKDEYIIYFDSETNKMAWLAYTVTFKDQEKSDNWRYIAYGKWETVNGLLLPKKITWWNVENGKPHDKKMDVKFDKITVTETQLDDSVFKKPTEAEYVQ
ncbi:DUF6503 family protein [Aequorivita sp. Q41]|uniref:DUF6503 family protein n=1 Tax=Aequorivita sp. Q41 TaxID=3153300 RepID=UPI003242DF42